MADQINLAAEPRINVGFGVKALRRSGKVPAVVYGHRIAASHIQLDLKEVSNTLRKAGRNRLITLNVGGAAAPKMVLTKEIQRDAIKRTIKHIDFYEVSMTEKIRAQIRVVLEGTPPDIKSGTGVMLNELTLLEIECLPSQLFDNVTINISNMKIDDVVRVKDIAIPEGVTMLEDPEDEVIRLARFVEAKVEEVVAEVAEVEVIEKGKKEEEGAEGDAAAAKKK
jgi:large subunit ribosomal protein L25